MDELKLSTTHAASPATPESISGGGEIIGKKKRSGCGCFLMGCFGLLFLIALPFIGAFVYLGTLDESDYGGFAIMVIKNETVARELKNGIMASKDMSPDEKQAVTQIYDKLLSGYDGLPAEKQETIKKNLGIVIKGALSNPEGFGKNPPPELFEIMTILSVEGLPPQNDNTPSTQANPSSGDPFNFDLPTTNPPPQNNGTQPSQYDF